jgi:hypothetical protein
VSEEGSSWAVHPLSINELVERNDVSSKGSLLLQAQRSWLKTDAEWNMYLMLVTFETFHPEMSSLKAVAK